MAPTDLLQIITAAFEKLQVPYAVVGSVASSYYGESRLTVDIDILAELRDRSRMSRRRKVRSATGETTFAAPDDVIIKKMEFYREGGSDKHLRDIAGMLKISGEDIDRAYIEEWSEKLGLLQIWRQIRQIADQRQ